jgi:hypothetical protein
MANTIIPLNTTTVTNITTLIDKPSTGTTPLTSTDLKKLFDKTGADLKTWINGTLNEEITKNSIPFAVGSVPTWGSSITITATITGIDTLVNGMAVAIECDSYGSVSAGQSIKLQINSLAAAIIKKFPYDSNTQAYGTVGNVLVVQENQILTLRYSAALSAWIVQ